MNHNENIAYHLKLHRIPDTPQSITTLILKVDGRSHQVTSRIPIIPDVPHDGTEPSQLQDYNEKVLLRFAKKFSHFSYNDSSVRVIRIGGVEELNPLNCANEYRKTQLDPNDAKQLDTSNDDLRVPNRESKVPNIPLMIRCQNCDTNFPTKYQFQRHRCEFNADKVVLKPNVDARDIERGLRMKFDCKTCGKQFVSKNNLERHMTSHDEDNVNICEYCNKQFVSENRLRIHKENHCKKTGDISKFYRSDVTVWRCTKCYQVFASENFASSHAEACTDIVTDPIAIKNANEDIAEAMDVKDDTRINQIYEDGDEPGIVSQHVEKVRTELLLQCEFCNRTYANKKSLLWHQDSHTTCVNYNCVICDGNFESYTAAAKHWLTDCKNEANLFFLPKLIYCRCCNRTFKSHELLYLHKIKKKHYTPKKHIYSDSEITKNDQQTDSKDKISKLDETSSKKIKTEPELSPKGEESKETIIKLIEDVLGSSKTKSTEHSEDEGQNADNYDDDDYDEDDDEDEFERGNVIKSEVTSEADTTIAEDAQDGIGKKKRGRKRKPASQNKKSKMYVAEVEAGYKYQCERCIALFSSVIDLEGHRTKEHPANYKCNECDQVLHSSKALMIHSRAHQSLKPYVCEICKRCYSQTSHLWQHMRFHQGIKPFACPHEGCEARYTIRPDLKDHIRKVHTRERPFKCTVCDKCFLTGSVYYQHRLIHTNDRRYACDICDKRFFRADALNNHRRIHTDERPYPCTVCGRNFRQKGDRNKHVRTQHPEFPI